MTNLTPNVLCELAMYLVKIEAGRMRVELERHAPLLRPLNHAFDVSSGYAGRSPEQTPSRVSEDP